MIWFDQDPKTAQEFVEMLAAANPIHANGSINQCVFCDESWAEESYKAFVKSERKLALDANARNQCGHLVRHEHHDHGCAWIIANRIVIATAAAAN